jgi:hypothetical protein
MGAGEFAFYDCKVNFHRHFAPFEVWLQNFVFIPTPAQRYVGFRMSAVHLTVTEMRLQNFMDTSGLPSNGKYR